jgi:hypothetical protein
MKNRPVKIRLIRKVANVYVLLFPKLNISLTVNEYYYQKMRHDTDEYEFVQSKIA